MGSLKENRLFNFQNTRRNITSMKCQNDGNQKSQEGYGLCKTNRKQNASNNMLLQKGPLVTPPLLLDRGKIKSFR